MEAEERRKIRKKLILPRAPGAQPFHGDFFKVI